MRDEVIFIFTRDRPILLKKTLKSIESIRYKIYIVDDSIIFRNQQIVFELCKSFSNCIYLGKQEFRKFIRNSNIDLIKFDFLLREVGNHEWNLGYTRNFALLYSKAIDASKVLFMDDDIHVLNIKLIDDLFLSVNNFQFVGAHVCGLIDDSILGHIASDIGITNERMLSGGFMVFNPNKIDHFFLNNYNEDWIWLFLQLKRRKYLQTGEVLQELTDPLANYRNRVMFQEFGEVALDGVLSLYVEDSYRKLTQLLFWEGMIKEREEYLDMLLCKSIKKDKKNYSDIIKYVKSNSQNLNASSFQSLFEKYFSNRILFQPLYKSLS